MKSIACVIMALSLLLLCSCESEDSPDLDNESIRVYRVLSKELQSSGELLRAESYVLPSDTDSIEAAIGAVIGASNSPGLVSAFPQSVSFISYEVSEGDVSVHLSEDYLMLEGYERTVADYCLTLTLCGLIGVRTVSIYAGGELQSAGMSSDSAVLADADTIPSEKQIRLYFPLSQGRYLDYETRSLTIDEGRPMGGYVLDELLRGPYDSALTSGIPRGTELLGVQLEDRICKVDFSAEFYSGRPEHIRDARLTVYSVVNSLTSLAGIDAVLILAGGNPIGDYSGIPLSEPLSKNDFASDSPIQARGEHDINIYFSTSGDKLAAIPRAVTRGVSSSAEQSAIEALLSAPGEPGFINLFSQTDGPIRVSIAGGTCIVTLPKDFFASRGSEDETLLALDALAATIIDIGSVRFVSYETDANISSGLHAALSRLYTKNQERILE